MSGSFPAVDDKPLLIQDISLIFGQHFYRTQYSNNDTNKNNNNNNNNNNNKNDNDHVHYTYDNGNDNDTF